MESAPFYSPHLSRDSLIPHIESIEKLLALINDPALEEEICAGNVTLAMIRPHLGPEANLQSLPDQEAANYIEEMVVGLGILAKFSIEFTPAAVEEFYQGDPQERMLVEPPRDPASYPNRWPEFRDFMSSGPTTVLLLHSPQGDAIPTWRAHLGHWNIDKTRDPSTIRGKLGVNKYNNLVHGSDEPQAVLRELSIISRSLQEQLNVPE